MRCNCGHYCIYNDNPKACCHGFGCRQNGQKDDNFYQEAGRRPVIAAIMEPIRTYSILCTDDPIVDTAIEIVKVPEKLIPSRVASIISKERERTKRELKKVLKKDPHEAFKELDEISRTKREIEFLLKNMKNKPLEVQPEPNKVLKKKAVVKQRVTTYQEVL